MVHMPPMSENAPMLESVTDKVHSPPPPKTRRNAIRIASDLSIKAMLAQGLSVRAIANVLKVSPSTVQTVRNQFTAEQSLTNGLMSPELDGLSAEVLQNFMRQGAKMKKVRGSDALGAVKVYADRRWPAKNEQAPTSISFVEINIGEVRIDPSNPQTIDISDPDAPGTCG